MVLIFIFLLLTLPNLFSIYFCRILESFFSEEINKIHYELLQFYPTIPVCLIRRPVSYFTVWWPCMTSSHEFYFFLTDHICRITFSLLYPSIFPITLYSNISSIYCHIFFLSFTINASFPLTFSPGYRLPIFCFHSAHLWTTLRVTVTVAGSHY